MLFHPEIKDNVIAQSYVYSWIDALRSGEYERSENRFTALGVACDIFDPPRWRLAGNGRGFGQAYGLANEIVDKFAMVSEVVYKFAMTREGFERLLWMDGFEEIADYIERELKLTLGSVSAE